MTDRLRYLEEENRRKDAQLTAQASKIETLRNKLARQKRLTESAQAACHKLTKELEDLSPKYQAKKYAVNFQRANDQFKQAGCEGKDKLTPNLARKLAQKTGRHSYRCEHCGRWHVGNPGVGAGQ